MRAILGVFLVAVLAALTVFGGYLYVTDRFVAAGPLAAERVVVVAPGSGVDGIAATLAREGVINDPLIFKIGVRLAETARQLKAGEYRFTPGMSAEQVMGLLVSGQVVVHRFTVAEGLTTRVVRDIVLAQEDLVGEISLEPGEGALLPETYNYLRGDSRDAVVKRMGAAMGEAIDSLWEHRAPGLPVTTKAQAVVLASIVEKETAVPAERARVAGVFINRLRIGMPLQSDPTVIYGLSAGTGTLGRALTRKDLETPHAWNTYVIPGLPPSPICNPGRESLAAVLNPADGGDLYFVADGSGGHVFAASLDAHNRNVARWRKIQRDQAKRE
ncbi:endolytic transglycosylase MltG [Rhodospirillum rubrum]|uniref:Endolytic murein transglycosylase n=1 Tax=Rhodospirillum rubrum (strain ATCC 11170 / ATH 1.1.1 / DSM 467 / LMG 4362 / NCIMB 8255 / S1) TaxID=269796 RepID=Q2RXC1_RHORT|nr:endolytic transglycosylase MltG [Rhodospirillum rubrum]ABC21224.1 Aminodeoxychorismate lyase [Rhodospirillum rubrum ATCC 11170]AEO46899.1 aminodeoxychorismate lyase [Rhodospirillum rubrum F11]MBK5952776.1 aminodeoxychorismate lyase [Rhodospirillum rubrum]QXG80913.1 endolytic transglycosylase MltG [Rhodospirillum rubrum]HAP99651.1 endolytic transglycosylase MltG [Rhodospirillum rubrum]